MDNTGRWHVCQRPVCIFSANFELFDLNLALLESYNLWLGDLCPGFLSLMDAILSSSYYLKIQKCNRKIGDKGPLALHNTFQKKEEPLNFIKY